MKLDTTFEFEYLDDLRNSGVNPVTDGPSHFKAMGYSSDDAMSITLGWMATFSHDLSLDERVANHNRKEEENAKATN